MKKEIFVHLHFYMMRAILRLKGYFYLLQLNINKNLVFNFLMVRVLSPFSWKHKLTLLEIEEQYEKVIQICQEKLTRKDENSPFVYEIITRNYRNLNRIDKASEFINKAKKLHYDTPQIYYEEGLIFFIKKNYPRARKSLEYALHLGHDTAPLHIHLGKVYYQLGLSDKAERCFNRVLSVFPREGSVYFLLGIILKNKMHYREAEQAFLKAIAYGSDQKEERLGLAEIYTRRGDWEKAKAQYQIILKMDPHSFVAHYFLGLIYEIQGYESKAIQELISANKINPDDEDTKSRLTKLLASAPS